MFKLFKMLENICIKTDYFTYTTVFARVFHCYIRFFAVNVRSELITPTVVHLCSIVRASSPHLQKECAIGKSSR